MTVRKLGYERWAAPSIMDMEGLDDADGVRVGDRVWVEDELTFYHCTALTGGRGGKSKWLATGTPSAPSSDGSLLYGLAGSWGQVGLGSLGQVLYAGALNPYWGNPDPGAGAAIGDTLYWGGASWAVMAPGTAGQVLQANGTGVAPTWSDRDVPSGGAQGDVLYHDGAGLAYLVPGKTGQILETRGAGVSPAWAYRDVPSGGSAGNILYHSGSGLKYLAAGTAGNYLRSKGAAPPAWEAPRVDLIDNNVTTKQVINTTTNTTLRSFTIPAGALTDGAMRWSLSGTFLNNTGSSQAERLRIRIGATLLLDITFNNLASNATMRAWWLDFTIQASGTTTHKGGGMFAMSGYSDAVVGYADRVANSLRTALSFATVSAEDNSSALAVSVEWKHPTASTALWIKREASLAQLLRAA